MLFGIARSNMSPTAQHVADLPMSKSRVCLLQCHLETSVLASRPQQLKCSPLEGELCSGSLDPSLDQLCPSGCKEGFRQCSSPSSRLCESGNSSKTRGEVSTGAQPRVSVLSDTHGWLQADPGCLCWFSTLGQGQSLCPWVGWMALIPLALLLLQCL